MIMLNDAQPTKLLSHTEAQKMFFFFKGMFAWSSIC